MPLEFLQSVPVVSEIRWGGGGARNSPPPSGARYKNTPVGRGLTEVTCHQKSNLCVQNFKSISTKMAEI